MSPNQRAIPHSMFQGDEPDVVIELSPAVVEQMGRIQARHAAGLFTAPEPADEVALSPELEQQRHTVLDKVGRVERERDIAVAALRRIRTYGSARSAEIADEAFDQLEGR